MDNFAGTASNDTFIADNSGGAGTKQLSVADSINGGAGNDTLRIFLATGDTATGQPALTSIENVYINGGAMTAYTAAAGTTSLSIDGAVIGTAATYTLAGQALSLSNFKTTTITTTVASTADTAANITVNAFTRSAVGQVNTLDLSGVAVSTLNLTGTTAASIFSLTNTGTALKTINVAGSAAITNSANAAVSGAVTTVDASAMTASYGYTAAAVTPATFKFTGGSANDTITFADDEFGTLTAGTQLNGGSGTDKIGLFDTAISAAEAAKINATLGFEVIGLNAAITLDASSVSNFKTFAIDTTALTQSLTNVATGTTVNVGVGAAAAFSATSVTVSGAVGVSSATINLGGATDTVTHAIPTLVVTGLTTLAISSNGTAANSIGATALTMTDNSTITITGNAATTLAPLSATATASKVDGSAATGALTLTGNATAFATGTPLGDILIGGSAADTIKASVNGGTLTGNAGSDTFNVEVALGGTTATFQTTTITDFTKGDKIDFGATAGAFTATAVNLSTATSVGAALDLLAAGNNSDLKWGVYNGNTYIVDDVGAGATFAATDTMVKLSGVLDLSTSTLTATVLTFA